MSSRQPALRQRAGRCRGRTSDAAEHEDDRAPRGRPARPSDRREGGRGSRRSAGGRGSRSRDRAGRRGPRTPPSSRAASTTCSKRPSERHRRARLDERLAIARPSRVRRGHRRRRPVRSDRSAPRADGTSDYGQAARAVANVRSVARPDEAVSLHQGSYANMCSCPVGDDPPRRPRLVLRVGRAAGRPAPAGQAGHRRRRRRAGRELRGEGVRRPDRDGRAAQARRLCPDAVVVPPRIPRVRRGEQGRVPRLRRHCAVVEGISIDEAFLDVRGMERIGGTPGEIAVRAPSRRPRAGRSADHGRRGAHQVPRQGAPAVSPSRTACSSFPPTRSSSSSTRFRSSASGASGRSRPRSSAARGITTVGQVAGIPEAALVWMLGRASAGSCTRSPTTATRGRSSGGGGARSIGSQCALGRGERPPEEIDAIVVALVDGVARRMRAARTGSGAPSCCDCGSTTSPGPRGRTRCGARRRTPGRSSPRCRTSSRPPGR